MEDINHSKFTKKNLNKALKERLAQREEREVAEQRRCHIESLVADVRRELEEMEHDFLLKKRRISGKQPELCSYYCIYTAIDTMVGTHRGSGVVFPYPSYRTLAPKTFSLL